MHREPLPSMGLEVHVDVCALVAVEPRHVLESYALRRRDREPVRVRGEQRNQRLRRVIPRRHQRRHRGRLLVARGALAALGLVAALTLRQNAGRDPLGSLQLVDRSPQNFKHRRLSGAGAQDHTCPEGERHLPAPPGAHAHGGARTGQKRERQKRGQRGGHLVAVRDPLDHGAQIIGQRVDRHGHPANGVGEGHGRLPCRLLLLRGRRGARRRRPGIGAGAVPSVGALLRRRQSAGRGCARRKAPAGRGGCLPPVQPSDSRRRDELLLDH